MFSTQRPPDDQPDALDHLSIGLVANRYTKLEKQMKICNLLSQGVVLYKNPTVRSSSKPCVNKVVPLKVRKFHKQNTVFSFPPKNEPKSFPNSTQRSQGKIRKGFLFLFGGNENKVILLLKFSDLQAFLALLAEFCRWATRPFRPCIPGCQSQSIWLLLSQLDSNLHNT